MGYLEEYRALEAASDGTGEGVSPRLGATVRLLDFRSTAGDVLPGAASYQCRDHDRRFDGAMPARTAAVFRPEEGSLLMPDCDVECNLRYRCMLMEPTGMEARGLIVLLHGLNEKRWDKYMPWALRLVRQTGKAVLPFPLAFHMNRTPAPWADARRMAKVSAERRAAFPAIAGSSLANAAISSRLHMLPQRFFWSGLQAYQDIITFVRDLRAGALPGLSAALPVDFFAYSIGAFLSEILLMADEGGLFASSRLFLFCGGPTLDRMYPTSRYILDSEATIALYSFFNEHLENEFPRDPRLAHYFSDGHPAGRVFRSMLSYHTMREERERRFRDLAARIRSVALLQDSVIPAGEVLNTLQGSFRNVPIPVDVLDFPYPYTHIQPFPAIPQIAEDVERAFASVMDAASAHLAG